MFGYNKRKYDANESEMNDHSKVYYLIGPDNQFISFYKLETDVNDLYSTIMDDISYDFSLKYVGTGSRPSKKINKDE